MSTVLPERRSTPASTPNPGVPSATVAAAVRHNWMLYAFLFLLPLQNLQVGYMPKIPGGLNFLNIGFLLSLYGMWQIHGHLAPRSGVNRWVWLYLGYCCFSLLVSFWIVPDPDQYQRINTLKDSAIGMLLLFVVQKSVTDWSTIKRILLAMLLPVPYILRVTWSQHASVASYAYRDDLRIHGTLMLLGANEFASFCVTLSLVLFALLLATKWSKAWRAMLIAAIVILVFCVLWSYSRTSYWTLLMGAAVILLLWRGRMKLVIPVILACAIGPALLPHSVVQRFNETHVEGADVDASTELRYVYWGVAWKDFTHHPLVGMGYHTFSTTNPYGKDTHNFFLRELAEKGALGFLITVGLFLSMAWASWRTYRDSPPDSLAYALGIGMCGAWPALVVTNIWGDRFTYTQMIGYYWVLLALCLKARELVLAERATATTLPASASTAAMPSRRFVLPARLRRQLSDDANRHG